MTAPLPVGGDGVRIVYNTNQINIQLNGPNGMVMRDALRRGLRVEAEAKRRCPADHGRLRGSITHRVTEQEVNGHRVPVVEVGTNVSYAKWVHNGTGIYGPYRTPIRPVRARFMRWVDRRGRVIFARAVRGQPPKPFLRDALRSAG